MSQCTKKMNLHKVCIKTAGKVAKAVPYAKANVMGMKTGEYVAYLTGSKMLFVIILWAM